MPLDLDNSPLHRDRNCLRAIVGTQFSHDVLDVGFHCLFGDEETFSNIPISISFRCQLQHFYFTFAQRIIAKMFSEAGCHFWRNRFPSSVDLADSLSQVIG